jgi:hypothetical protein
MRRRGSGSRRIGGPMRACVEAKQHDTETMNEALVTTDGRPGNVSTNLWAVLGNSQRSIPRSVALQYSHRKRNPSRAGTQASTQASQRRRFDANCSSRMSQRATAPRSSPNAVNGIMTAPRGEVAKRTIDACPIHQPMSVNETTIVTQQQALTTTMRGMRLSQSKCSSGERSASDGLVWRRPGTAFDNIFTSTRAAPINPPPSTYLSPPTLWRGAA